MAKCKALTGSAVKGLILYHYSCRQKVLITSAKREAPFLAVSTHLASAGKIIRRFSWNLVQLSITVIGTRSSANAEEPHNIVYW